ncbi:MAG: undecaprenyl-phosphate glucose phosphotransferase [Propylenella sp.]
MAITETTDPVGASQSALAPALGFRAGRTPLNVAAAQVASTLKHRFITPGILAGLARIADFVGLSVAGMVIAWAYVIPGDAAGIEYFLATFLVPAAAVLLIGSLNGYAVGDYRTRAVARIGRGAAIWTGVFACFALVVFFLKMGEEFSRVWLGSWFLTGLLVLTALRIAVGRLVVAWTGAGVLERRAVLVGGGPEAVELIRALRTEAANDIRICGIFDDREDARVPAIREGLPRLGRIDELLEFGRRAEIDMLIVAMPMAAEHRLVQLMKTLWVLPVDIRLSAGASRLRFRPRSYSYIGAIPFLDLFDKPIADWDYVAKACFDRVVGSILLLLFTPVMLAVALAVKLDSPGPALFRQKRYGFNNELIEVFKFRSMYVHQTDANAEKLATRNDPRITRVGRFIRKTSLDELPQLINVALKGNLSLVGPRPHAVQAKAADRLYEQVVDGYFARHRVKPGISGWAQVNGWRGETDTREKLERRVEHDLFYIENWSVIFDLYILALTPFRLLSTENAY